MLDLADNRQKIIDAALKLAETEGWRGLSLDRIANQAGVPLIEFRKHFPTKTHILNAFSKHIDEKVLEKVTAADASTASRDRLFDVLMTRFEIMSPYKPAIRRIREDLRFQPGNGAIWLTSAGRSLYWMMVAAGIDAEGTRGAVRLPGLVALYARVFEIWLDDDDPGHARTMAALDSRLRRGERIAQRVDNFSDAARNFCARMFPGRAESGLSRQETAPDAPGPEPGPATNGGGAGPAQAY